MLEPKLKHRATRQRPSGSSQTPWTVIRVDEPCYLSEQEATREQPVLGGYLAVGGGIPRVLITFASTSDVRENDKITNLVDERGEPDSRAFQIGTVRPIRGSHRILGYVAVATLA